MKIVKNADVLSANELRSQMTIRGGMAGFGRAFCNGEVEGGALQYLTANERNLRTLRSWTCLEMIDKFPDNSHFE